MDHGRDHIRNGNGQPGEIDLAEDSGISRKSTGIFCDTGGKVDPNGITAHVEQNTGNAIRANACDTAEHKGVNDGTNQRVQEQPCRTQNGLLVGNGKIPLGK